MRARAPQRILLVVLLLAVGLAVAMLRPGPEGNPTSLVPRGIWSGRRADLAVQLGLMLVGALGIRALLPDEGDEDPYEREEVIHDSLE